MSKVLHTYLWDLGSVLPKTSVHKNTTFYLNFQSLYLTRYMQFFVCSIAFWWTHHCRCLQYLLGLINCFNLKRSLAWNFLNHNHCSCKFRIYLRCLDIFWPYRCFKFLNLVFHFLPGFGPCLFWTFKAFQWTLKSLSLFKI